jgi:hypothetical protein
MSIHNATTPAKADRSHLEGRARYGQYYWCVKSDLSEDGEIYVYADAVRYEAGGVLFVARQDDGGERINLALAAGQWTAIFAASCLDGHAVAVEHWKGEVAR